MEDSVKIKHLSLYILLGFSVIEFLRGGSSGNIVASIFGDVIVFFVLYILLAPFLKGR